MPNLPKSIKVLAFLLFLFAFSASATFASTSYYSSFSRFLPSYLLKRLESKLGERPRISWPAETPQMPTTKLLPTAAPTGVPAFPTVTLQPTAVLLGDYKKEYIMNAINEYRRSRGLSEVKTDPYTCSFAKERAREISVYFNHDGFSQRVANKSLPYPGYSLITENIAMTSDYKRVVELWINSKGHAENMQKDTPFVCVESYGNYYAYEGWRP
jgi:uncharacterized protein YkwD